MSFFKKSFLSHKKIISIYVLLVSRSTPYFFFSLEPRHGACSDGRMIMIMNDEANSAH